MSQTVFLKFVVSLSGMKPSWLRLSLAPFS